METSRYTRSMRYTGLHDHFFDWKGFSFVFTFALAVITIGIAGKLGVNAIGSNGTTSSSTPVSVVESLSEMSKDADMPTLTAIEYEPTFTQNTNRIIDSLSIADAVPKEGKFIAADLVQMKILLYENESIVAEYPILSKGKPSTPWETPSGFYSIRTKEDVHFSSIGKVFMPFSMQFYGNYFIHGWTYYPDGTPTASTFSGGCIKLSTIDSQKVFQFADIGTKVFVYDARELELPTPLTLEAVHPYVRADAYLVADLDTGHVYAEKEANSLRPISSITKLMTALVANEIISFEKKLAVSRGSLLNPPDGASLDEEIFVIGDLFYPLLMQSSDGVADSLANYYGTKRFVRWMNTTAKAFDMTSTTFSDASGLSGENISTPDDLFRLAAYLANKKSFVISIAKTKEKVITADDGSRYTIGNVHIPLDLSGTLQEHVAYAASSEDSTLSVASFKVGERTRRVAIVILGSHDEQGDSERLSDWVLTATESTIPKSEASACVSCTESSTIPYRRIAI